MKRKFYKLAMGCIAGILLAGSGNAQTIYTFAGNGASGFSGDGGPATAANLNRPGALRTHSGNLYFSDANNERIRSITGIGYTINTVAGNGTHGYTGDGGPATAAELRQGGTGGDIVFDNSGNMFFTDLFNNCVRKVDPSGVISTIAGTGSSGSSGDGGPATAAELFSPYGLAIDAAGNIYVADDGNSKIRKIDIATGIITTIAGTGTLSTTGDGGAATAATIQSPMGLAIDMAGDLYFSQYSTGTIRKINMATGIISTHATGMANPVYIQFDQAGNLFAGNGATNGQVYKITAAGAVTVVAGSGTTSLPSGDGGPATAAGLWSPFGVAVTATGSLLISDRHNHRIRIVTPVTATLSGAASVCTGSTTTLTASIPGAAWISGSTGVATVSAAGVVTGVTAGTATITYVAGLIFGTKVITVNAPVTPVISASGATLSVTGTFTTYQWSLGGTPISGATNATYDATTSGTYAVTVTDAGGCSSTSASYVYTTVSVNSISQESHLRIFPNPSGDGRFTVNVPSYGSEMITMVVVNSIGQKVYETETHANTPLSINMSAPAGVYTLQVTTSSHYYSSKLIIQ